VKGGVAYWIFADQLGSPTLVVNSSTEQIVEEIDYDAFGNVIKDTNPGFQPFGFASGLYDVDIKLVHFGARDYDPSSGRWIAKDPILFAGGDTNLYGYGENDPVNMIDPSGMEEGCACKQNEANPNRGRDWGAILAGEDTLSRSSWIHGGDFLEGGSMVLLTTFGAAFVAAGGIIADVFSSPARPFANIGCLTCEALKAVGGAYKYEFATFIEPSFPWQVGEAAVETAQETLNELFSCWEVGITSHHSISR
jgi:RHS repeat-associated protein